MSKLQATCWLHNWNKWDWMPLGSALPHPSKWSLIHHRVQHFHGKNPVSSMVPPYCCIVVSKYWHILLWNILIRNPFQNGENTAFSTFINWHISFPKMNWQGAETFHHLFQKETGSVWWVISTEISKSGPKANI